MKYVYIIRSLSTPTEIYTGVTHCAEERLKQHNEGSSPHTAKFRPWELVVAISFTQDSKVFEFEKYLKSGSGRAFAKKRFH